MRVGGGMKEGRWYDGRVRGVRCSRWWYDEEGRW